MAVHQTVDGLGSVVDVVGPVKEARAPLGRCCHCRVVDLGCGDAAGGRRSWRRCWCERAPQRGIGGLRRGKRNKGSEGGDDLGKVHFGKVDLVVVDKLNG